MKQHNIMSTTMTRITTAETDIEKNFHKLLIQFTMMNPLQMTMWLLLEKLLKRQANTKLLKALAISLLAIYPKSNKKHISL